MFEIKKIILTFLVVYLGVGTLFAAEFATISVDKAVVYADKEMTAPIGYLVRGKKIRIGDKALNKGTLYHFILHGKLVYIETKNVSTSKELLSLKKSETRMKEIDLVASDSAFALGAKYFRASFKDKTATDFPLSGLGIYAEINNFRTRETRSGGVLFLKGVKDDVRFEYVSLPFAFSYQLISSKYFVARPEIGINLIPYAQYAYKNLFQKNTYGYGGFVNFYLEIKLKKKHGILFGGGYEYNQFSKVKAPAPYKDLSPLVYGMSFDLRYQYHF